MTARSILTVKDGDTLGAVREFLKDLLAKNIVGALLVPVESASGEEVSPKLVREPAQLEAANPLAPTMRVNSAAQVARLYAAAGRSRLGAVLHPCEVRALVELAKAGIVPLDQVVVVGIDCMGTYESDAYAQFARASLYHQSPTDEMLRWTRQGPIAPYRLRNACQMCEQFVPENTDITIGLIGLNVRERLLIEAREELAARLHLANGDVDRRERAIARLSAIRQARRGEALAKATALFGDLPSLLALLASCEACGDCLGACPLHSSQAFQPDKLKQALAADLSDWPSGEGWTMRARSSGPLQELVEFSRRAASCVGCGMCESACPNHVPLTAIQAVLGRKVRETFDYVPGRSLNEKLPWLAG